jgi:hypothetical protein
MILACYYPKLLPGDNNRPRSEREIFWLVAEGRGLNQSQILKAWNARNSK